MISFVIIRLYAYVLLLLLLTMMMRWTIDLNEVTNSPQSTFHTSHYMYNISTHYTRCQLSLTANTNYCVTNAVVICLCLMGKNPVHTTYGAVRWRTLRYGDVVIQHVDLCGSVHTHTHTHTHTASSYVDWRNIPHKSSSICAVCCFALPSVAVCSVNGT